MKYALTGTVVAGVLFFISRKLFATILFVFGQVIGNVIIDRLRLNRLPVLNWDYELSNILIITATATIGPGFALLFAAAVMAYHAFHEEVTNLFSVLDFAVRSLSITGFIALSGLPLTVAIPWAILISKVAFLILFYFRGGKSIFLVFNYKEIISVFAYFAVFNLF